MKNWTTYTNETPKVEVSYLRSKYIVKELGSKLTQFFNYDPRKPSKRTQFIKCALCQLGHKLGFKVYANRLPGDCPSVVSKYCKNREWLYDLHWYTEVDFIKDLPKIIKQWTRHSDPVSNLLWEQLSKSNQMLLANYQPSRSSSKQAKKIVDEALNTIIKGGLCIYNVERFKGIKLRPETIRLQKKNPTAGSRLEYLNRLLLQDAFPVSLSRNHHYQPISLPLVVECQWDPTRKEDGGVPCGDIKFDFQKLLVTNAKLRLMIFKITGGKKHKKNSDLDKYFEKAIKRYRHLEKDPKFLFIAFDQSIKGFHYAEKPKVQGPGKFPGE